MTEIPGFWAVIPAGGAGTRLWPLSRARAPKFLLDLTGSGRTLLQATADRLAPLAADRIKVVTGLAHQDAVAAQLPQLPAGAVMAEPSPRDSMAAIGWAAAAIEALDPEAIIGSFAADHVIDDQGGFEACVREAVEVARTGRLVTLGIRPTYAATGFGYIQSGVPLADFDSALVVNSFVEKPDAATAADYLASGEYRWNAGMFVVKARVLLDLLRTWHPELADGVRALAADPNRLTDGWSGLEKIAIDHAVAEPAAAQGHVAVVPATFPWEDIGDFNALRGLLAAGSGQPSEVTVLGPASLVTAVDASGLVVTGGRQIAVVGLEDVVVVDTGDALLVTNAARAQDVKAAVDALKAAGRTDLT